MLHENTPTLETQRLILRKFTKDDLPAFWEIMKDKEVNTFLPWFPLETEQEATDFLTNRFLTYSENPFACRYAVCLKENNIPIGYVWLSDSENHDFGYGLKKEFWHKGIITEAAETVVEWLKNSGLPYITATHDVNNPRSGAVMKKLSMTYKYSYLEQWQPKNIPVTFRMYQRNFDENAQTYMEYWNKYQEHFVEANVM